MSSSSNDAPTDLEGFQLAAYQAARSGACAVAPWQDPKPTPAGQTSRWIFSHLQKGVEKSIEHVTVTGHLEQDLASVAPSLHDKQWTRVLLGAFRHKGEDPTLWKDLAMDVEGDKRHGLDCVLHMAVGGKEPVVLDIYPLKTEDPAKPTMLSSTGILHIDERGRMLLRLHEDHFVTTACGDIDITRSKTHADISGKLLPSAKHPRAVELRHTFGHSYFEIVAEAEMPDCTDCKKGLHGKHH